MKHSIGIESLYDTLHMGEFKRMDKDLEGHQHQLGKRCQTGFRSTLNDEPLLVGLRVDMNLAQFRAFNKYNQNYRQGKKHVFVAY